MDDWTKRRLLRLPEVIAPKGPLPLSRSGFLQGVREGRFPQPVKLGPRITCWRSEDILALVDGGINAR